MIKACINKKSVCTQGSHTHAHEEARNYLRIDPLDDAVHMERMAAFAPNCVRTLSEQDRGKCSHAHKVSRLHTSPPLTDTTTIALCLFLESNSPCHSSIEKDFFFVSPLRCKHSRRLTYGTIIARHLAVRTASVKRQPVAAGHQQSECAASCPPNRNFTSIARPANSAVTNLVSLDTWP